MLRRLQRVDPDGNRHEIWVNPAHVMSVTPSGSQNERMCWVAMTPRSEGEAAVKVVGWARDVALELNGHFDE